MAIFGAPIACEDHARRGVHALAVHRALAESSEDVKQERELDFEVRSSLNTGLVVASQASGRLEYEMMTRFGDPYGDPSPNMSEVQRDGNPPNRYCAPRYLPRGKRKV